MGLTKGQELRLAVETLCDALREDPDYFYSWQSNIAMAFKDEHYDFAGDGDGKVGFVNRDEIHEIANSAAKRFLSLLIDNENQDYKKYYR